jgi:hypothetical protein
MAVGFPVKANYATGDVLTAANMNDLAGTVNLAVGTTPSTGTQMAGKNAIINGDFAINQRGFTSLTATNFGFDRFNNVIAGGTGTATFTPQVFTPGTAPVAGYESTNYLRVVTTGQSATSTITRTQQSIEDVRTFAGQTATFSFWAKAATGTPSISVELGQGFGSGGSPSADVTTLAGKVTLSTSWARYSVTVAVPSISGKTLGTAANTSKLDVRFWVSAGSDFNARTGTLGIQSNTFEIWGVQAEAGSILTPFQTASGTLQGELALCQRYYFRFDIQAINTFGFGFASSTTNGTFAIPFPVPLRTAATALEQSGTTTDYTVTNAAGNQAAASVPAFGSASKYNSTINCATSSLTSGEGVRLRGATTAAYLAWSAEL